jgi:hypothetical protein
MLRYNNDVYENCYMNEKCDLIDLKCLIACCG